MPIKIFITIDGPCPFGTGNAIDSPGCRKCKHFYRTGTATFFWCKHPEQAVPKKAEPVPEQIESVPQTPEIVPKPRKSVPKSTKTGTQPKKRGRPKKKADSKPNKGRKTKK